MLKQLVILLDTVVALGKRPINGNLVGKNSTPDPKVESHFGGTTFLVLPLHRILCPAIMAKKTVNTMKIFFSPVLKSLETQK